MESKQTGVTAYDEWRIESVLINEQASHNLIPADKNSVPRGFQDPFWFKNILNSIKRNIPIKKPTWI